MIAIIRNTTSGLQSSIATTSSKDLTRLTGYPFDLLAGKPQLNEDAVQLIITGIDSFIEQWAEYPEEIKKVHALIKDMRGVDIYDTAATIPEWLKG